MSQSTASSRRAFLKGGVIVAAPLAAAASTGAVADDGSKARLQRLEDEAALRDLHQAWLRRVNAGDPAGAGLAPGLRSIAADPRAGPDAIVLAADGLSATGRFACTVELHTAVAGDCTLVQMARLQGNAAALRTERRVLRARYVKSGGAWAIAGLELGAS